MPPDRFDSGAKKRQTVPEHTFAPPNALRAISGAARGILVFGQNPLLSGRAAQSRGQIPPLLATAPSGGGASDAAKAEFKLPIYRELELPIGEIGGSMLTFN